MSTGIMHQLLRSASNLHVRIGFLAKKPSVATLKHGLSAKFLWAGLRTHS